VEIRGLCFCRISKPGGKSGKLAFGFLSFPRFPRGVISMALFTLQFSERSDAAGASSAALVPSSLEPFFSFWAKT